MFLSPLWAHWCCCALCSVHFGTLGRAGRADWRYTVTRDEKAREARSERDRGRERERKAWRGEMREKQREREMWRDGRESFCMNLHGVSRIMRCERRHESPSLLLVSSLLCGRLRQSQRERDECCIFLWGRAKLTSAGIDFSELLHQVSQLISGSQSDQEPFHHHHEWGESNTTKGFDFQHLVKYKKIFQKTSLICITLCW